MRISKHPEHADEERLYEGCQPAVIPREESLRATRRLSQAVIVLAIEDWLRVNEGKLPDACRTGSWDHQPQGRQREVALAWFRRELAHFFLNKRLFPNEEPVLCDLFTEHGFDCDSQAFLRKLGLTCALYEQTLRDTENIGEPALVLRVNWPTGTRSRNY